MSGQPEEQKALVAEEKSTEKKTRIPKRTEADVFQSGYSADESGQEESKCNLSFYTAADQTKDIIKPSPPKEVKFINFNTLVAQNKPVLNLSVNSESNSSSFFAKSKSAGNPELEKAKNQFMVNQNLFCNEAL